METIIFLRKNCQFPRQKLVIFQYLSIFKYIIANIVVDITAIRKDNIKDSEKYFVKYSNEGHSSR